MLAGLLAPLRLPERVLEALDELRPMRSELTRVREQTKPLGDLLPALEHLEEVLVARLDAVHEVIVALESEESYLNRTSVELGAKVATLEGTVGELASEVGAIHKTVKGVQDDIKRMSGLRGKRGIAERARDVIVGGSQE